MKLLTAFLIIAFACVAVLAMQKKKEVFHLIDEEAHIPGKFPTYKVKLTEFPFRYVFLNKVHIFGSCRTATLDFFFRSD